MVIIHKGKIIGFSGSWESGLASLQVKDSRTGKIQNLSADNAPLFRALERAFGGVLGAGHTASIANIKGKEIYWVKGDWVDIGGFTPVEEASVELERQYEKQFRKGAKKKIKNVV